MTFRRSYIFVGEGKKLHPWALPEVDVAVRSWGGGRGVGVGGSGGKLLEVQPESYFRTCLTLALFDSQQCFSLNSNHLARTGRLIPSWTRKAFQAREFHHLP